MHLFLYTYHQWAQENLFISVHDNQHYDKKKTGNMSFHGLFILKPYTSIGECAISLCRQLGISIVYFNELEPFLTNMNEEKSKICEQMGTLLHLMHNNGYMYNMKKYDKGKYFDGISCSPESMSHYYETNIALNQEISIISENTFVIRVPDCVKLLSTSMRNTDQSKTIMDDYMKMRDSRKYLAKHMSDDDSWSSFEKSFTCTLFPHLEKSNIIHTIIHAIKNGLCDPDNIIFLRFYILHNIYEGMLWGKRNNKC